MVSAPEFLRYPELRPHFDAMYDLVVGPDGPRAASPLLDVGVGNGSALAAVAAGTDLGGVAVDVRLPAEWLGPPGFALVQGDGAALPFADGAFPVSLQMETLEWLTNPAQVLREMGRVTRERVVLEHTEWQSLWFDSDDPETSREFTRLFAGSEATRAGMGATLAATVEEAGLTVVRREAQVIRGDRIAPDTYARHLLALLREWLCNQLGAVRARRFDQWRRELEARSARGEFAFSVDRHVVVAGV